MALGAESQAAAELALGDAGYGGNGIHSGVRKGWVESQVHPLAGCANLGREPDLSGPHFSHR